jgi:hypothetical protein
MLTWSIYVKFPNIFYRNWATFLIVFGLILWVVPYNVLIFVPIIVVWAFIALVISAGLMKAWEMFRDES